MGLWSHDLKGSLLLPCARRANRCWGLEPIFGRALNFNGSIPPVQPLRQSLEMPNHAFLIIQMRYRNFQNIMSIRSKLISNQHISLLRLWISMNMP